MNGEEKVDHASALAFVQLTDAMEGSDLWVAIGAVWAVEKSARETYTTLKTAEGPVMVMEPPSIVFERMYEVASDHQPMHEGHGETM